MSSSSSSSSSSGFESSPEDEQRPQEWWESDRRAMRWRLLNAIHGYYLEAISRLPTADLRTTIARGLLVGGHCYGPRHPVHNIILNSLWYGAAFPLRSPPPEEVRMVSGDALVRICHRSLEGLVTYLRHCCPSLATDDDALYHLNLAVADLPKAIASANRTGIATAVASLAHDTAAYKVAAEAAEHPNPEAFALFASSLEDHSQVGYLLCAKRLLSSSDLQSLSGHIRMLLPRPQLHPVLPPRLFVLSVISSQKKHFKEEEQRLLQIVGLALHKFALQTGKQFELHVICGVNLLEKDEVDSHQCYHMNFFAYPSGSNSVTSKPVLFFCEALVPALDEKDILLCVPVQSNSVGYCSPCVENNKKIAHPTCKTWQYCLGVETGNENDFVKPLDADYIFFDADRDNKFANFLHNHDHLMFRK